MQSLTGEQCLRHSLPLATRLFLAQSFFLPGFAPDYALAGGSLPSYSILSLSLSVVPMCVCACVWGKTFY